MELKNKIKAILSEEMPRTFRTVPWNGMYDSTVDKIVKLLKEKDERD
tara:strand:+ start:1076 stop:1216 length:141 start_codon:yes stop_codon:yes gene_type:complete